MERLRFQSRGCASKKSAVPNADGGHGVPGAVGDVQSFNNLSRNLKDGHLERATGLSAYPTYSHPASTVAMSTVAKRRETAVSIIEDIVGDDLAAIYVSQRDPLSGEFQDRPGLVVIVDGIERTAGAGLMTELESEIADRTGTYRYVFVHSAGEEDELVLPKEEVIEV